MAAGRMRGAVCQRSAKPLTPALSPHPMKGEGATPTPTLPILPNFTCAWYNAKPPRRGAAKKTDWASFAPDLTAQGKAFPLGNSIPFLPPCAFAALRLCVNCCC